MGELKATLPALTSLRFLCGAFRRRFPLQPGPPDISALARRLRLRAGDVFLHSVRLCADLCQRRVCRHRLRDAQRTAALHHRACCTALAGLSCGARPRRTSFPAQCVIDRCRTCLHDVAGLGAVGRAGMERTGVVALE